MAATADKLVLVLKVVLCYQVVQQDKTHHEVSRKLCILA